MKVAAPHAPRWVTPQWPAPTAVRALSTLRSGGASRPPFASLNLGEHVGDAALAVVRNRRSLQEAAGLPNEPAWLVQVHGTAVVDLDAATAGSAARTSPTADAAVTGQPNTVCAILTADCLPVLFANDAGDRVGAAHAGWRGLAAGVIESTVAALGVPTHTLMAWLGPAIGPQHFEVGAEVRDEFLIDDPGSAGAFARNERGRFMADLFVLARQRLARLGIDRVFGGTDCTYTHGDTYFSHRRDGPTGRQATLIWLQSSARR